MKHTALPERIAAARDRKPDRVLKNANVVNVFTNEIIPCDVALLGPTIIGLGTYDCQNTYDCKGAYLCPGFIDSHVHIESSMACPPGFAKIVLPFGTTTVVADPHEIANVCGLTGIRSFYEMSQGIGLNVYYMFPSCVPCTEFEENYAPLTNEDAAALLYEGVAHGLGEVMDWNAVTGRRKDMMKKLAMFEGRPIDGHAPGLRGAELAAYLIGGPQTDHEAADYGEVVEKLRAGMRIMIRLGSAANNMDVVLQKLAENKVPLDNVMFCTDDKHTENILAEGHINFNARSAVRAGIPAAEAVKMATINAARAYGLAKKGAVAPGYDADLALFSDLVEFRPVDVFVMGKRISELSPNKNPCPSKLRDTVRFAPLGEQSFHIAVRGKAPVIEMPEGQLATRLTYETVPERGGAFVPDATYAKLACVERHHATGHIGLGIVKQFGLRRGAFASTVAHDSHNIVVLGVSDADMHAAVRALKQMGGGYALAHEGKVIAALPLPVGGLVSDEPYETLIAKQREFLARLEELGVPRKSDPLIRLSFLCLPVIPEARVTTRGVYDVLHGRFL